MKSRIVLDAASMNHAIAHFLMRNTDSPVKEIRLSARSGKIHAHLLGIEQRFLPQEARADIALELFGQHIRGEIGLLGAASLLQGIIAAFKIDSFILWLYPSLRKWGGLSVQGINRFEIDINAIPLALGDFLNLPLGQLLELEALSIGSADDHLLTLDFSVRPPQM